MKLVINFAFVLLFLFLGQFSHAQSDQDLPFTDIAKAKTYAKEKNKPILMVFAGSDWCKPCIQFKRGILSNDTFKTYAKDNLAVLYLDFPLKKANKLSAEQTRKNELMAEKYNPSGAFPHILLLSAEEKVLGQLSFSNQDPTQFIESCKSLIH
jgi:thioredoxin-related protein